MQNTADNHWLAFVNSTSWSPLQGQATLLDQWAATTRGASTNDSQLIVTIPDANETQVVQVVYNKCVCQCCLRFLGLTDIPIHVAPAWTMATTLCES